MSDEAMNNLAEAINNYTNEIRKNNPNRLLSVKDVAEEYGINERTVYKRIFNNPSVVTHRLSNEKVIKNAELWKYFDTVHED